MWLGTICSSRLDAQVDKRSAFGGRVQMLVDVLDIHEIAALMIDLCEQKRTLVG
jgi:hypothetical protein